VQSSVEISMKKNISLKQILTVAGLSFFLTAVMIFLQKPDIPENPVPTILFETGVTVDGSPYMGSDEAPVTIDLYSDFTCPHCRNFAALFQKLSIEYIQPGNVQVVYHTFPNPRSRTSYAAARAAVSALEQGTDQFWQYHDLLFINQNAGRNAFGEKQLESYAKQIGLDVAWFQKSMTSKESEAKVNMDISEGQKNGVDGVPSWFIKGRKIFGTPPESDLRKVLDSLIESK
jgi:protein-disulfide isomerase